MKEKEAKKKAAAKKGRASKFDSSSSANESSSESSASEEEDEKSEDMTVSNLSDEDEDGEKSDSDPSKSTISGLSQAAHEHNTELLDDLFPGIQHELLLVVNYSSIIFLDNFTRERPILEIKLENLLYVMGKGDFLKIGFQLDQSVLKNDRQKSQNIHKEKRKALQTNENYQQEVVDIKAVFIIPNARVVAEDIIAYI